MLSWLRGEKNIFKVISIVLLILGFSYHAVSQEKSERLVALEISTPLFKTVKTLCRTVITAARVLKITTALPQNAQEVIEMIGTLDTQIQELKGVINEIQSIWMPGKQQKIWDCTKENFALEVLGAFGNLATWMNTVPVVGTYTSMILGVIDPLKNL